jgi:hypothetical protein
LLRVGENLIDHPSCSGFEVALSARGRATLADLPVLNSVIRYLSEMCDAGPNDMQILWFTAIGTTEESLSGGRTPSAPAEWERPEIPWRWSIRSVV